ncbi:hypothetical protein LBMAG31_01190 [Nitrosomonadaceae bacterium]|nr:hypothetical protein LBMAG31_01190 [Nitrosomonadaceae bacterium]
MALQFSTDEADSKQNNSRTIISRVNLRNQSPGVIKWVFKKIYFVVFLQEGVV